MRLTRVDRSDKRENALWGRGSRGESCSNALWGRGGRRSGAAVAVLVVTACALASTATAGTNGGHPSWSFTTRGLGHTTAYVPTSLATQIQQNPSKKFDVIVEGTQTSTTGSAKLGAGLRNSLLNARHGSTAIGGSQIRGTFRAIDGVHAMLSGAQIAFLAKTSFVSAIVPNDKVELSSVQLPVLEQPEVAVGDRRAGRLEHSGDVAVGPDDRGRRLRHRRLARRLRLGRVLDQVNLSSLHAELAGRRLRTRHLRGRHRGRSARPASPVSRRARTSSPST